MLLQGGVSTGRTVDRQLRGRREGAASAAGASLWTPLVCHQDTASRTQVKWVGTYTVPRLDVLVSAVVQKPAPAPIILANYVAPNAAVAPSLGRSLSGNAANMHRGADLARHHVRR